VEREDDLVRRPLPPRRDERLLLARGDLLVVALAHDEGVDEPLLLRRSRLRGREARLPLHELRERLLDESRPGLRRLLGALLLRIGRSRREREQQRRDRPHPTISDDGGAATDCDRPHSKR